MTRSEVRDLLGGNARAKRIDHALAALVAAGLVLIETCETAGRPVEVWRLVR